MDALVTGLYVISLFACCLCLWLWYEIETYQEYVKSLRLRILDMEQRVDEVERKKR